MRCVLVIDDDDDYRVYLISLLTRAGYAARGLRGGRNLREVIATEPLDAVITDLYMPEIDGIEIVRNLQELVPHVPVIGITGGGSQCLSDSSCKRAMAAFGAVEVLTKPVDAEALLSVLRDALEARGDVPQ